jgi:repressor LexA
MGEKGTITPKQKRILDYIQKFSLDKGYIPSQKEIARHFRFKSLGTVQNYLVRLEEQGWLEKAWNSKRGMRLLNPEAANSKSALSPNTTSLPLSGQVAAGQPIEVVESQDTFEVPSSMLGRGEHFVLQVSGQSMVEEGILNGDYVIIKKQSTANNGDTVVALVENAATIKRFYKRKNFVELLPANKDFEPIIVKADQDLSLAGILVGVVRKL